MIKKTYLSIFKSNENLPYGFEISTRRYSIVKMNNRILFTLGNPRSPKSGTASLSETMKVICATGQFSYRKATNLLSIIHRKKGSNKEQFLEWMNQINSVFLDRNNYVYFDNYYKEINKYLEIMKSNPLNGSARRSILTLNENLYHHLKEQIGIFNINNSLQT